MKKGQIYKTIAKIICLSKILFFSFREDKEKFLVPFKNEDSLMNLVLNKEKKPSLVYYYIPGHGKSHFFREAVLNVASDINEYK